MLIGASCAGLLWFTSDPRDHGDAAHLFAVGSGVFGGAVLIRGGVRGLRRRYIQALFVIGVGASQLP